MNNIDISELIVEADFLWREISVGDRVQVEYSTCEQGVEMLTAGKHYMVLAKLQSVTGVQSFITESNVENTPVVVYPQCVCNYVTCALQLLC